MLKGVAKTIKMKQKNKKEDFLSMLLGTLGASFSGKLLSEKGIVNAHYGNKKERNCKSWLWK